MADEENKQEQEQEQEQEQPQEKTESKVNTSKIGVVTWVIIAAIAVLCAGSGLLLGRLLAGSPKPQQQDSATVEPDFIESLQTENQPAPVASNWYYNKLQPVVANLDEPGVTRYVRATITLEMSSELERGKGELLLDSKEPILTNWLTIYLASLTLEDARGNRNLKRIQAQILDAFNEKLFPDAKPQIKKILFKEFAIQ